MSDQKFHFDEGQIYTTFHGRPEMCIAFADSGESGTEKQAKDAAIARMVARANMFTELVGALAIARAALDDASDDVDPLRASQTIDALMTKLAKVQL